MEIFLLVLLILVVLIVILLLMDVKVYVEFENVSSKNLFKLRLYLFSFLPVFQLKREIKSEKKKQSIKEKIDMIINYVIKSKADPIDFAKKEIKKSDKLPISIRNFDFSKIHLESMKLNLCLDFDNAAISAIGTGAVNAIISMVTAKYANNIDKPVVYKVFPGYTGNGVKVEVHAKIRIKAIEIIKGLLKGRKEKWMNIQLTV